MSIWDKIDIGGFDGEEPKPNPKLDKLLNKTHNQLVGSYFSSVNQRGVPKPESVKIKISQKLKGKPLPESTKQKMAKSRTGREWGEKTIEKFSKAARKRMIPISQYDLNGNWIRDFAGLAEMCDELGLNKRNVQVVCNNWKNNSEKGSKQCGGFIWKYKENP